LNQTECYEDWSVVSIVAAGFFGVWEVVPMETTRSVASSPLLLTIPDVARRLGLGRTKVYELIAREGLPVVRFGRAVRVSVTSLQQWIEQREKQNVV
jgi:excisionase family DNA binding protein